MTKDAFQPFEPNIGIIGLGYVGLPLAVEFGKQLPTTGFDINEQRVAELQGGRDSTLEVSQQELASASKLDFTSDAAELGRCNVFIVTVPTPIDQHQRPDLRPLQQASRLIGSVIKPGAIAIFESTVYPGCTEEACIPIIEEVSGLQFNRDFYAGYSPERINPGDKQHSVSNIIKVTSGSTPEVADFIDALYRKIVTAGTHKASSIMVAEAAKVIENTQRDVNIALINELALIFDRLNLDTLEVLEAAGSKWNFLPFRPGLVGGHCIGVDPYYLTYKTLEIGYHPEVILAGRRINDNMGFFVAERIVKLMASRRINIVDARILIMGLTFKENCPDLRNTRVVDIVSELERYHAAVSVFDPWVDQQQALDQHDIQLIPEPQTDSYDAIVICVAHDQFKQMTAEQIRQFGKANHILFDAKHVLAKDDVDGRL